MSLAALSTGAAATRLETDEIIADAVVLSRPSAQKVANIATNPLVALHLDDRGGVVVTIEGRAEIVADRPPERLAVYARKYRDGFTRLGTDADAYLREFSIAIVISPTRARVFAEL